MIARTAGQVQAASTTKPISLDTAAVDHAVRIIHQVCYWLHKFEDIKTAGSAAFLGGDAELNSECSGERLMRAVSSVESDGYNIGRTSR